MRRLRLVVLVLLVMGLMANSVLAEATEETNFMFLEKEHIYYQGDVIEGYENPFVIEDGEYLVPIRLIAEAAGYDVFWGSINRTVWLERRDEIDFMGMVIGRSFFGEMTPIIIGERTMVPIKFLIERMNLEIVFCNEDLIIIISFF